MSSELLGAAQNVLKGNLGGAWDINKGYADAYTDLGIARRFGDAAAAYSLRDIGAMNGRVIRGRRSSDDVEEDFSANQISSGALEEFATNTSITTGVAEMAQGSSSTLSNASTTGFTLTQDGNLIGVMFPFSSNIGPGTKVTMTFTLSEDSGDATCSFRLFGTSGLLNAGSPSTIAKNDAGTFTIEFEATSDARGIGFFDNESGSVVTISNTSITIEDSVFVETWYDQSGNGNDATQTSDSQQPKIVENGSIVKNVKGFPAIKFESANSTELDIGLLISNLNSVSAYI